MLKWSDEALNGEGYIDWYPYDHPQLGPVELGGWNMLHAFRNPPCQFLEDEITPFADWLVWHLLISPRLALHEVRVKALGEGSFHLRVVVQNRGWLPTYVTKQALQKKLVRGVIAEIELPEGASLEAGEPREELGQLEGRAYKPASPVGFSPFDPTEDRTKAEWVVHAPQGGVVKLTVRHERAGTLVREVELI
jgi:hypothetical protein